MGKKRSFAAFRLPASSTEQSSCIVSHSDSFFTELLTCKGAEAIKGAVALHYAAEH